MSRVEHLAEGVTDPRWVTIYALCQPIDKWRTGEVRYVGKTVGTPWHRVRAHAYAAKRGTPRLPVLRWLRKQIDAGNPYHIRHLERVPPGVDWAERERFWIAKYRADGVRLLNLTEGGDGLAGHRHTQAHKDKIAAANRTGASLPCMTCGALFWRKLTEIEAGNAKFCSRPCYAQSRRGVHRFIAEDVSQKGRRAAAAKRSAMTECKRGHPLSGDNMFLTSMGGRGCKECRRIHKAAHRARGGK